MARRAHGALLAAVLLAGACQRQAATGAGGAPVAPAVEQAKALIGEGQPDAALAKLQQMPADADTLYYQGVAWARKAESAPLPTPPPAPTPMPKGTEPPAAPEFKPEEIQAAGFFEKAIAARPDHPQAQLALAELLAPHAVRRHEIEEQAAWKKKTTARGKTPPPPTPDPSGIDYGPDRIVRAYEAAIQGEPSAKAPVEALIAFAVRVKRLEAAEGALQELAKRVRESPEPFVRYGDFLLTVKKDPEGAIEQYRQALIWRPDDEATRGKVAGIYIDMGVDAYGKRQYAVAQSRFSEAAKYVTDKGSPQGLKVQDYLGRLREIRGR